jgi:hypothetical protein
VTLRFGLDGTKPISRMMFDENCSGFEINSLKNKLAIDQNLPGQNLESSKSVEVATEKHLVDLRMTDQQEYYDNGIIKVDVPSDQNDFQYTNKTQTEEFLLKPVEVESDTQLVNQQNIRAFKKFHMSRSEISGDLKVSDHRTVDELENLEVCPNVGDEFLSSSRVGQDLVYLNMTSTKQQEINIMSFVNKNDSLFNKSKEITINTREGDMSSSLRIFLENYFQIKDEDSKYKEILKQPEQQNISDLLNQSEKNNTDSFLSILMTKFLNSDELRILKEENEVLRSENMSLNSTITEYRNLLADKDNQIIRKDSYIKTLQSSEKSLNEDKSVKEYFEKTINNLNEKFIESEIENRQTKKDFDKLKAKYDNLKKKQHHQGQIIQTENYIYDTKTVDLALEYKFIKSNCDPIHTFMLEKIIGTLKDEISKSKKETNLETKNAKEIPEQISAEDRQMIENASDKEVILFNVGIL